MICPRALYTNFHSELILKSLKMQTQITKFFKSSQTNSTEGDKEGRPIIDGKTEPKKGAEPEKSELDKKADPEKKSDSEKSESDVEFKSGEEVEVSSKRPAEDEGRAQKKIMAVESPLATPTKSERRIESVKTPTSSFTPAKQLVDQENKASPATPLIDLSIVIRKKISNGAFALHENIGKSWFRALQGEFDKPYFKKLSEFVKRERSTKTVYPPENKVYSWTHHHDIKDTRVLILGQDPYHGPGQAHGLSFSVQRGVRIPPSLVNIYKELESDIPGFKAPPYGDLTGWAKQGVLMLNTCLTVNQGQAYSHQNKGWETFTDAVLSWISKNSRTKVVFLLWGRPAQRKQNLIDKRHKILTAAHPSPLSAHNGFFSCAHFSQANSFLKAQGLPVINWAAL